jgi:hypothetical protein
VVRIRDKAAASKGRCFVKAVLSLLFAWGAERGYAANNPATSIRDLRRQKGAPEANRPWTDLDVEPQQVVLGEAETADRRF